MALSDTLQLVEAAAGFQAEFLAFLAELDQAGETYYAADLARRDFTAYLDDLQRQAQGRDLAPGLVPQTTLWLVQDGRTFLGESRLRHALTPALEAFGGHIGYVIRPSQRRRGYGVHLLRLTLDAARRLGLQRVRVTCDTDNLGSARIIEHNGGVLSGYGQSPKNGKRTSQYWIDL